MPANSNTSCGTAATHAQAGEEAHEHTLIAEIVAKLLHPNIIAAVETALTQTLAGICNDIQGHTQHL